MADLRPKRVAEFIAPFRVTPGRRVRLPHDFDPAGSRVVSVKEAKQILREGVALLSEYQTRLAAQDTHGVVVVLQALDAAIRADLRSLRIIHGKGTGALRERVTEMLQKDTRVKGFRLGAWNEGGTGVTIVDLG